MCHSVGWGEQDLQFSRLSSRTESLIYRINQVTVIWVYITAVHVSHVWHVPRLIQSFLNLKILVHTNSSIVLKPKIMVHTNMFP